MKAEELQIGDWVFTQSGAEKVAEIREDVVHTDEWAYNYDAIKPIPLEKIHLAKNGFTADEEDETFIYEDGYEVGVSFDGGCKELELEPYIYLNINFAEKHLSMEIENMHQLQQAMRLMGCDKEIKL